MPTRSIETMDHNSQGTSSEGPSTAPSTPRNHYVYTALSTARKFIQKQNPGLRAPIPARLTLTALLEQLAKAMEFNANPVWIPGVPMRTEAMQRALRAMALQNVEDEKARVGRGRGGFSTQMILAHGLLESAGLPRSLTPDQRAWLKECIADVLDTRQRLPDRHFMVGALAEAYLPAVECTVALAAIDHEDPMPQEVIPRRVALWDTGAVVTCVTDDTLTPSFRRFVDEDGVHDPYRFLGGTRVHFSCLMEFSNGAVVQFDTVAVVVPRAAAPNGRSGVMLGQRGLIDSLRYESVPRRMAVIEDPAFTADRWGRFDVKCHRWIDGEVQYFE